MAPPCLQGLALMIQTEIRRAGKVQPCDPPIWSQGCEHYCLPDSVTHHLVALWAISHWNALSTHWAKENSSSALTRTRRRLRENEDLRLHYCSTTTWLPVLKTHCCQPSFYFVYGTEAWEQIYPQLFHKPQRKKISQNYCCSFQLDICLKPLKEGPLSQW